MNRVTSAEQLQVFEEVGRGAFGVVYRGMVRASMQEVAIKQIDLEHEAADFQEVYKEIQILSECQSPQITKYLGCFVQDHTLWVIMEFVDGGTVFEVLKAGPITTEQTVATLVYEIVLALEYLHGQRKIHRDLKSANILVSSDGAVKLTDFGVSTQLQSHFSRRNTTVGTPYWMAPEIINNTASGHGFEADIWSLGCCIYEFFTGAPPLQHQYSPMQALRRISAVETTGEFFGLISMASLGLSASAEDFLRLCFAVAPKMRPSPSLLLQHPFMKLRAVGDARKKCLEELVAQKRSWDAKNGSGQAKKYFPPTENAHERLHDSDTIHFDISTIHAEPTKSGSLNLRQDGGYKLDPAYKPTSRSMSKSPRHDSGLQGHDSGRSFQHSVRRQTHPEDSGVVGKRGPWRTEFRRILSKVVSKIERKSALSTGQQRQLEALNEAMMEVFSYVPAGDGHSPSRILACQYLRYMIREIRGSEVRGFQKAMLPSDPHDAADEVPSDSRGNTYKGTMESRETKGLCAGDAIKAPSALDDIERSLLASWLDSMGS